MSSTNSQGFQMKPYARDIRSEELRNQLFQAGPADENSLPEIIDRSRAEKDQAAEAIACFSLGYILDNKLEKPMLAISRYNRALKLYPRWPEAYFNRGVAYIHLSSFSAAIQDFDEVERLLSNIYQIDHSSLRASYEILRGKSLLFRAEARLGLNDPNEAIIARDEILSSQLHLKFGGPEGEVWLSQIGERLRATYNVAQNRKSPRLLLGSGKVFWSGFIASFITMLLMYLVIKELSDTHTSATETKSEQNKLDAT
ncbi:tetratricopeptide repeat protein [Gimesia maris]|uniref:tetratricopeptide repeat protein n=1 Tax=Gimesia maris TaxID=122 RepID=UPI0030D93C20|tara:strand:+ start:192 stop:959 length:768 start_codon:yes stop_codon:yes gene_type:complete